MICRLMMISHEIVQSKKVSLAVQYFPVTMPSASSRPYSLAMTHLPNLWRFLSQGVRNKLIISIATPLEKGEEGRGPRAALENTLTRAVHVWPLFL